MRIPYGEIIQSASNACIAANRKVRLVSIDIEGAPVYAADSETIVAKLAPWERHRQIVFACLRPARSGVQNGVRCDLVREIIAVDNVHPHWEPCSKRVPLSPYRIRRQRVVVPGNEKYRRMRHTPRLKSHCEPFPKVGRRIRIIEYVSGTKYRIHRIATSYIEDAGDDVHTSPRQLFLPLFWEGRKASAKVPVGGMQQSQHDFSGFGAFILNAVWKRRGTRCGR